MRILDLFCGAGGAAAGYARAFPDAEIIGVDIDEQPNYPFFAAQLDAVKLVTRSVRWLQSFDLIHASPPCQGYSTQTADRSKHPRLIGVVRDALRAVGVPYVIENVEGAGAHMEDPVRLCGSSFGLDVRRHRLFETNWGLIGKPCDHSWQTPRFRSLAIANHRAGKLASVVGVHGHINYAGEFELRCKAMDIHWMTNDELVEAIPPAYTEYIGQQFRTQVLARTGAVDAIAS